MLIALSLSLLTAGGQAPVRKAAAGTAPFALEGIWVGEEIGDVGRKHPIITFTRDGGTLAYEDSTGGTGTFTMRLQAVKVEGTQVRFSAPGGGKLRLWSGRWDGKKITGTIAADASGGAQIGTFVLRRPLYEEAPRRASDSSSHQAEAAVPEPASSGAESERAAASESASSGANSERAAASEESPSTSGGYRQREEGVKRLKQRLRVVLELAMQLNVDLVLWQDSCRSGGTARSDQPTMDCDRHIDHMGQMGLAASKSLEQAEDEARRAGVDPGTVRQLRADQGLDSSKWDELFSQVRQAQEEWARRKR